MNNEMNKSVIENKRTQKFCRVFFGFLFITGLFIYISEKWYAETVFNILFLPGLLLFAKIAITEKTNTISKG